MLIFNLFILVSFIDNQNINQALNLKKKWRALYFLQIIEVFYIICILHQQEVEELQSYFRLFFILKFYFHLIQFHYQYNQSLKFLQGFLWKFINQFLRYYEIPFFQFQYQTEYQREKGTTTNTKNPQDQSYKTFLLSKAKFYSKSNILSFNILAVNKAYFQMANKLIDITQNIFILHLQVLFIIDIQFV
ncbi:hypothetical protein TTHERM_001008725 (macronuclear) [Tetrahymena thermophila SB210]|uniref:Uncharacterized protein n=1 Tax=Tetrahymena thermophila (strain SB210) TaxID=312017 RepID=W7XC28_TETTS|nr:hypothetical protein TTHERM_001008725 [Tetrahymena thermophila SB210]EWS71281.1 hypothetical protein TTHERM_001008725 [Tetrahymena thermophila SB210]|eukprot:XP_012656187.1 hypothetical protein TTHERM_001008725 [Tetrahymena thermophila SB210]